MPLYEVVKTYYVWAEDELEAEYHTPMDIAACDTEIHEIRKSSEILANWQNAIPFGSQDNDKTCDELVTTAKEGHEDSGDNREAV